MDLTPWAARPEADAGRAAPGVIRTRLKWPRVFGTSNGTPFNSPLGGGSTVYLRGGCLSEVWGDTSA